ncbi:DUF350 domain-containing protein [Salsuginibacillus kocurii]|uniref:DUF350 domain-containing protein n=1 Tax=Salsuginibacillus kocurii TaxID=427078 RepID=UPI000377A6A7|nr:DUF350 domain-containing protein [Salsuginibacillus kocurii]
MEDLLTNPFIFTAAQYSVAILALLLCLFLFELLTPYKNWEEVHQGNVAVALATGGKIVGVLVVFAHAIYFQESMLLTLLWGIYGFALLILGYMIFEFLTPLFKVDKELAADNRAVGFIAFVLSVALSFVIGASMLM